MRAPGARRRRHLRRRLAARDGAVCFYCRGAFGPELAGATIDHLVPRSAVDTWTLAALVLACRACNEAKGADLPQKHLRPVPGQFGPGLVPLAPAASRTHRTPRLRVRAVRS